VSELSERRRHAIELFAPLAPTYDRYARLLSFGQDARWRRFLVDRVAAGPEDHVLDVATGTGSVAIELVRRQGCRVTGVDQSGEMLEIARTRAPPGVRLVQGHADALPFPAASFDALTFTYLMRYVDDPATTLAELARVVKPGGTIAGLEFAVPENPLARVAWEGYVRAGLPVAGRLIAPGWDEVGSFLGDSVTSFWDAWPLDRLVAAWGAAGIGDVRHRSLSFGGGIVLWGRRA
jgi:demethylmenaquinone methyltransferase / 2-methoxy-6-polyprenyl-1,4-benzoquinol methylase